MGSNQVYSLMNRNLTLEERDKAEHIRTQRQAIEFFLHELQNKRIADLDTILRATDELRNCSADERIEKVNHILVKFDSTIGNEMEQIHAVQEKCVHFSAEILARDINACYACGLENPPAPKEMVVAAAES